jgi:hypothetical protein
MLILIYDNGNDVNKNIHDDDVDFNDIRILMMMMMIYVYSEACNMDT